MLTLEQFHSGLANGSLARAHHIRLSDGLTEFPDALYQLADTLEILDLSGNRLSTLPNDLTRFARLRILFASNNPFSELPRVLGRMPELEMVGFKACRITHVPDDSLPARLRWLILTDNRVQRLPESIGQCTRLQKLMLSCNQLRQLPQSLQHCQALELLRMASNRFEDTPEVIFRLPRLAWLTLAGNPMTQKQELDTLSGHGIEPIFYQDLQIAGKLGEGLQPLQYGGAKAGLVRAAHRGGDGVAIPAMYGFAGHRPVHRPFHPADAAVPELLHVCERQVGDGFLAFHILQCLFRRRIECDSSQVKLVIVYNDGRPEPAPERRALKDGNRNLSFKLV